MFGKVFEGTLKKIETFKKERFLSKTNFNQKEMNKEKRETVEIKEENKLYEIKLQSNEFGKSSPILRPQNSEKHEECLKKVKKRRSLTPNFTVQNLQLRNCEKIHYHKDEEEKEIQKMKEELDFSTFDSCDEEVFNILNRSEEDIDDFDDEFYIQRSSCNLFFD